MAKLTTAQKVLIGVGIAGGAYLLYKIATKPKTTTVLPPAGTTTVPGAPSNNLNSLVSAGSGIVNLFKGIFSGSSSTPDAAPSSTSSVPLAQPTDTVPVTSVLSPAAISDSAPDIFMAGVRRKKYYMG